MAAGDAPHNQCPPGGADGIVQLAALLNREILPLNPANGIEKPLEVAIIDEAQCIGCTLCIQACPVDAIVGAAKLMHTIIAKQCTGCELCVAPCPVDCIRMEVAQPMRFWNTGAALGEADVARERYDDRNARLVRIQQARDAKLAAKSPPVADEAAARKKAIIAAAIAKLGTVPN